MKLHQLPKTTTKSPKRLGRGYGSGVGGHTVGRGQKGQKARSSVAMRFEGGQLALSKRLPFWRGKDRFKSTKPSALPVNIERLNALASKTQVTLKTLVEAGIISEKDIANRPIKLVGSGELTKVLEVHLDTTKHARAAIERAGGSIASAKTT